jgi:hypothetical protein
VVVVLQICVRDSTSLEEGPGSCWDKRPGRIDSQSSVLGRYRAIAVTMEEVARLKWEALEKAFLVRWTGSLSCMKKQTYEYRRSKSKIQVSQAEAMTYRKSTPGSAGAAVTKATYQPGISAFAPRDDCNMGLPMASEPGR